MVKHEEFLEKFLIFSLRRVYSVAQVDDFTASHYLYNLEKAIDRIYRYLKAIEGKRAPILSVQAQVSLNFVLAHVGTSERQIRLSHQWNTTGHKFKELQVLTHKTSVERHIYAFMNNTEITRALCVFELWCFVRPLPNGASDGISPSMLSIIMNQGKNSLCY